MEPREPLSRDRVLRAAIRLADAEGIEAITMRRLGQQIGVEAMTLYYHVGRKGDLLNGIVDLVNREIELPNGPDWKVAIRGSALSARDVFLAHPWAAGLTLSGTDPSPARLRWMDAMLGTLRGAGFSADLTDHAYHALDSHIMGFTLWHAGMNLGSEENLKSLAAAFLETLPRDEMPHLADHVEWHLEPRDPSDEGTFAFGLDLILEGLERKLKG